MAFPVGYFLSRLRANKQHIMLMLIMLPMWMNFLLRTYAWMTLLEKNGLINKFFGLFGLGPFNMINTSGAVVLGMVYNYLPLYDPAHLHGHDENRQFASSRPRRTWAATSGILCSGCWFRLTGPGIATGITQVFVPAVSTFIISRMLGGGSNLLIGDLIELQFLGNSYNLNLGSAMSLVLMVIVLLCMSFTSSFDESEMEGGDVIWQKAVRSACKRTYIMLVFCFMYLPIAVMIAFSFNESKSRSNFTGFTLGLVQEPVPQRNDPARALGLSLVLALVSSIIATVLGTLATIGINSMSRKSQLIINNISYVPVVNPEIITGVSLMLLFVMAQNFGIGGESGIFGWPARC